MTILIIFDISLFFFFLGNKPDPVPRQVSRTRPVPIRLNPSGTKSS